MNRRAGPVWDKENTGVSMRPARRDHGLPPDKSRPYGKPDDDPLAGILVSATISSASQMMVSPFAACAIQDELSQREEDRSTRKRLPITGRQGPRSPRDNRSTKGSRAVSRQDRPQRRAAASSSSNSSSRNPRSSAQIVRANSTPHALQYRSCKNIEPLRTTSGNLPAAKSADGVLYPMQALTIREGAVGAEQDRPGSLPGSASTCISIGNKFQKAMGYMNIGIECEFLVESKKGGSGSMNGMVEQLARLHNKQQPKSYPKMSHDIRPENTMDPKYAQWLWTMDSTIQTSRSPWGLELVSPILDAKPDSPWRDQITNTFTFLENNCIISNDQTCGTHIHVSRRRPHYGVRDLRRIASAALWFEAALEAIVPESRRDNDFCRANYINSPGAKFGRVSRLELIREFETVKTFQGLMTLFQNADRHFSWNFWSMTKHRSLEFRKPPPSTTLAEVRSWVEYTLTFVQAAVSKGTPDLLIGYEQNIGGLKRFLGEGLVEGLSHPQYMDRLWRGHADNEALEPYCLNQPRDPVRQEKR